MTGIRIVRNKKENTGIAHLRNSRITIRVVAIDMLFRVASLLGSYNPEKKGQLAKRSVSKKIPKFPAEGGQFCFGEKFWGN